MRLRSAWVKKACNKMMVSEGGFKELGIRRSGLGEETGRDLLWQQSVQGPEPVLAGRI